jgi:hypothetical protein
MPGMWKISQANAERFHSKILFGGVQNERFSATKKKS